MNSATSSIWPRASTPARGRRICPTARLASDQGGLPAVVTVCDPDANGPMLRRSPLALVLLLTAVVGAEEPTERRLGSLARAGGVEGPLDWVLERVPSGSDEWSAERLQDEISSRLTQLADRISALDLGESALAGLLAPDFRSGMLECPPLSR